MTGGRDVAARALTWRGLHAYRERRFTDAAALHEQALALRDTAVGRLSSVLNAASARLALGELDAAGRMCAEAREQARQIGHVGYERRAEVLLRSAANRAGATTTDAELLEACPRDVEVHYVEAMIACRSRAPSAIDLVTRALALAQGPSWAPHAEHLRAMATSLGQYFARAMDPVPYADLERDVLALRGGAHARVTPPDAGV